MSLNFINLLHLSLIDGVGFFTIQKLIKFLNEIYFLKEIDFIGLGISSKVAQKLYFGLKDDLVLQRELELINKYNIKVVTYLDEDYPFLLKNIFYPPIILYYKGEPFQHYKNNIAVVGSRKANEYGKSVVNKIIPNLAFNGVSIVSGGAIGIDSLAHEATVECGGKTIAVLGSGLLRPYPYSNKKLFEKILAKEKNS